MYILTQNGNKLVKDYIKELEAKRKDILDAGKDTADETSIPTVEDIQNDIEFTGVNWNDPDGACYFNGFGVTDNYEADNPILLKYGRDFVESGYIPTDDNECVQVIEQYTNGNYHEMIPGTTVMDYSFGSFWKVLSNDGKNVKLQNEKSGTTGVRMDISDETSNFTFVLLAKVEAA